MTALSIAADLRLALSPVAFARHIGIEPDPWQCRVLKTDARQVALVCGRQVGKSTVVGILALHVAVYEPGSLTLLVSPSQRQSGELFRVVRSMADRIGVATDARERSTSRLTLANGSRILSLPGNADTVRGFANATQVIADEAAFIPDELFVAISPTLAVSGGRLVLASTPDGKTGFLADVWRDGGDAWARFRVQSDECPRIRPEFLARQRLLMTDTQYRSEYQAEFTDAGGAVFRSNDLARLVEEGSSEWEL